MVADALAVIDHEDLKRLFGPGSRAEAAIAGRIETADGPAPVSGDIDRLAVFDDEVLLADYKTTTRPPPADEPVPAGAAAQLALYRALLQDLFPAGGCAPS